MPRGRSRSASRGSSGPRSTGARTRRTRSRPAPARPPARRCDGSACIRRADGRGPAHAGPAAAVGLEHSCAASSLQLEQPGQVGAQPGRIEAGSVAQNHEAVRVDHVDRHAAAGLSTRGSCARSAGSAWSRRSVGRRAARPRAASHGSPRHSHSTSTRLASCPAVARPCHVARERRAFAAAVGRRRQRDAPGALGGFQRYCAAVDSCRRQLAQVGRAAAAARPCSSCLPVASRKNAARRRRAGCRRTARRSPAASCGCGCGRRWSMWGVRIDVVHCDGPCGKSGPAR